MRTKFLLSALVLFFFFDAAAQQYSYPTEAVEALKNYTEISALPMPGAVKAVLRDDCDDLRDSIIFRNYQNGTWAIGQREILTYDEENRRTRQGVEQNIEMFGGLTLIREVTSEYSEGQRVDITSTLDFLTGEFELRTRATQELNAEGSPLVSLVENYDENTAEWVLSQRRTYSYENNSTSQILYELYDADTDTYTLDRRTSYSLTAENQLLEILNEEYDEAAQEWTFDRRFNYEYDALNRLISFTWTRTNNFDEVYVSFRDEFVYDENNDNFEVLEYRNFDSTPEGLVLFTKVLNIVENGLNSTDSLYFYTPDADTEFTLTGHIDNEFDAQDRLILYTEFDLDNNPVSQRETWFRECVSAVEGGTFQNAACAFPNPLTAGQRMTCDFTDNQSAVVNLYDLTGRRVLSEKMNAGEGFYFRNLPQSGAYILTVEGENAVLYREKVIIAAGR